MTDSVGRNVPRNPATGVGQTTPATPAAPAAATSTPAGATTTPATPPKWAPGAGGGGQGRTALAQGIQSQLTNFFTATGPTAFDMVPGRYPDAVPLPTVLAAVGSTPEGRAALNQVLDGIKAKTGVDVPPDLRAAVMANPTSLTHALEQTPAQMSAGVAALNKAYQAGKVKQAEAAKPILPQTFDLSTLAAFDAPRPTSDLKQLAPGLFQGDLPSTLPDAQVKQNRVIAEVFGRLSNNPSAAADQKFTVKYGDKSYTKLDDFVGALKADGYQIDIRFDSRVANFANLKTVVPNSNPPKFVDVPAPLMVKTGIKDALGKEAELPAVHSEMIVSIKSGPNTKGPKVDSDIKFYQGISGTGFFPTGVWADPTWCGRVTTATLSGDQATKALSLAGTYTDLVNTTAKKDNLYADGYGVTGVCNDSVAVVEKAITGHATQYPLLMNDSVLMGTIKQHLSDADHSDDASYKAIKAAIIALPTDTTVNASTKQRALASMPWPAGQEPFTSSVEARRILSH